MEGPGSYRGSPRAPHRRNRHDQPPLERKSHLRWTLSGRSAFLGEGSPRYRGRPLHLLRLAGSLPGSQPRRGSWCLPEAGRRTGEAL